ncbi:hypothetical protein OTU49_010758 [Cherax quadricarinatus]|uniref:Uncharacterized protein n=1 Tax=Cherax quadricarinatus TaxID=27406 RepID=A0AAW0W710_CHEQU|nr:uncharacterized protein LOC128702135 [Cherax quadricarinatus]
MKTAIYILVITCMNEVLMNPVKLSQQHSDFKPLEQPFFRATSAKNKLEHLQKMLKKVKETCVTCNELSNTLNQNLSITLQEEGNMHINRAKESSMTTVPSLQSRVENILRRSPHKEQKLQKKLPGILRMEMEMEEKYTSKNLTECSFTCPNDKSLFPCVCDPCEKSINCSAIGNLTQLYQLFNSISFPATKFDTFLLSSPPQLSQTLGSVFLDNTFGLVSFKEILVENTDVEQVMSQAFNGSENTLAKLTFRWNYNLKDFPFAQLASFPYLETLEVSGGSLGSVPAFSKAPSLAMVFLNQNKITEISPMAFANLPELTVLDLGFNNLQTIEENCFYFSAWAVITYLDDSNISFIHERAFSYHQPGYLDVSTNKLTALDQKVFQPILDFIIANEYNSFVDAEENPLCCSNITWILTSPAYDLYTSLSIPPCTW